MPYAASISLEQTIKRLLKSSRVPIAANSSPELLKILHDELLSIRKVVEKLDSDDISINIKISNVNKKRLNVLDGQIREAIYELEDVIKSHVSNHLGEDRSTDHPLDLQELEQDIVSFVRKVSLTKAAYIKELFYPSPEEEHDDDDDEEEEENMVGLSDQFTQIKDRITSNLSSTMRMTTSLVGMAGIGKTTLAMKLCRDPLISNCFERRAFVTIGPKYELENVMLDILKQVIHPESCDGMPILEGEAILDCLRRIIYQSLKDRRYLIVLDDVWDEDIWDDLAICIPKNDNGSQVLLTTRLKDIADISSQSMYIVRFLNKKESWDLLRRKVFGEMPCPSRLEKAGKKIAEKCEGLALTIVSVAKMLPKADDKKTEDYWNEVATEDKQNSVFMDAYDQMSKVLLPSYDYLPQYLKPCFLYMGVFPQSYEISCSTLSKLWTVEGFCKQHLHVRCLMELDSKSLVVVHKIGDDKGIKTCSLISPFWYLCNKQATKNKFFHGLNSRADGLAEEHLKGQRRLCIRNNILFAIEDVYNSIASLPTVHSILCTGPYHQYPVPICLGSRFLRVLDALTIRFYEFPITEEVNLAQLAYLALTFDGRIPSSISMFWNLRYLIVNRHRSIIDSNWINSSYLPMEIWHMQKLKHLQAIGRNLPHPTCEGSVLPKLSTLLDVSPQSCTKDVFERIPNLQTLGIRIELDPVHGNADVPLSFFDHISRLHKLLKLKCTIVNPMITSEIVPLSIFSSSLTKIALSGFGYPWEELSKISSSLPNIFILKLRCYAFRGPKWEVGKNEFRKLRYLLIEDTDLVNWTFLDYSGLRELESLNMRHCYKLEEMPLTFGKDLRKVKLVDCNPRAVSCAEQLKEQWEKEYYDCYPLEFTIHSSWDI